MWGLPMLDALACQAPRMVRLSSLFSHTEKLMLLMILRRCWGGPDSFHPTTCSELSQREVVIRLAEMLFIIAMGSSVGKQLSRP